MKDCSEAAPSSWLFLMHKDDVNFLFSCLFRIYTENKRIYILYLRGA